MARELNHISCSVCEGRGEIEGKECSVCQGIGSGVWFEGMFLYWGKRISSQEILKDKIKYRFQVIINTILFVFGVLGLVSLFWVLYNEFNLGVSQFEDLFFWRIKNGWMLLFWLSFLTDLFLYFRLIIQTENKQKVREKIYKKAEELKEISIPQNWDEVKDLSDEDKIDISKSFTVESLDKIFEGFELAKKINHQLFSSIHLFASCISAQKNMIVLGRLGIRVKEISDRIKNILEKQPFTQEKVEPEISPSIFDSLFKSYLEAYETRQEQVSSTEIIVGLADDEKGDVYNLLYDLEVDFNRLKNVAAWLNIQKMLFERYKRLKSHARLRSKTGIDRAMTAVQTPFLDRFSEDLTRLGQLGYLEPCIARDKEIEEIFRLIEGGNPNVIIVGESGVGKTAIIEGIAQRIIREDVPKNLIDRRLISLSIPSLVAGAAAPGELEERMATIVYEIRRAGNILLYIDNIQNLTGVGSETGIDLADVLANALSGGDLIVLGSTNSADFRSYIEKSSALMGVFQKFELGEMDDNQAIQILEAKAGAVEYKNSVYFSYDALEKAVTLSRRYIHEQYLPQKAISIIEEAAVYVRKKKGKNSIVLGEDVAEIISQRSKVKVTTVTEEEKDKLLHLEEYIHQRVIGQEEAVTMVAEAIRRARVELREKKKPIANLLFLGPTGVGKTELAKTVAEVYFGSEENMIRLDMSEYQDKTSIHRLIGVPGSGEGGILTESVRKQPYTLLLLDEIEKAHPDILNIFLQVMDDGRLTDAVGRTIDFTNIILIATSNAGTQFIQDKVKEGVVLEEIKQQLINEELRGIFKPEFLNRFDGVIVFKPLNFEEILAITKLLLKKVQKRLEEKGIIFEATDEAVEELAQIGFDPAFGARPLRRAVQERVDSALAKFLLTGKIGRRDVVILEKGGQIRVEKAEKL